MDPKLLLSNQFNSALVDYFYLIDREYPEKGTLKLVGDRYRLSTEFRSILYRGIASTTNSLNRASRLVHKPMPPLIIDGYNVLMTLMNYRLGRFVFISTDGICRDAGWQFGNIASEPVFDEGIALLANYLQPFISVPIIIYLDSFVTQGPKHRDLLKSLVRNNVNIELVNSADKSILQHTEGTIATSDSELIDNKNLSIIDIPMLILKEQYHTSLFNLKEILIH
jgi:hypothetical protein